MQSQFFGPADKIAHLQNVMRAFGMGNHNAAGIVPFFPQQILQVSDFGGVTNIR